MTPSGRAGGFTRQSQQVAFGNRELRRRLSDQSGQNRFGDGDGLFSADNLGLGRRYFRARDLRIHAGPEGCAHQRLDRGQ